MQAHRCGVRVARALFLAVVLGCLEEAASQEHESSVENATAPLPLPLPTNSTTDGGEETPEMPRLDAEALGNQTSSGTENPAASLTDGLEREPKVMERTLVKSNDVHDSSSVWTIAVFVCFMVLLVRNRKRISHMLPASSSSLAIAVCSRLKHMGFQLMDMARRFGPVTFSRARSYMRLPNMFSWKPSTKLNGRSKSEAKIELISLSYEFVPQLLNYRISPIISKPIAKQLSKHLPVALQLDDWKLIYSSNEHGSLLSTLLEKAASRGPSVLVIKDESNNVFGAFISESWRRGLFGNGQMFVFSITPEMKVYKWSQNNSHFMNVKAGHIAIGGPKCAIWMDGKLRSGLSEKCETFSSDPLPGTTSFKCYGVELWGFVIPGG